jgi:hypothetical protein
LPSGLDAGEALAAGAVAALAAGAVAVDRETGRGDELTALFLVELLLVRDCGRGLELMVAEERAAGIDLPPTSWPGAS